MEDGFQEQERLNRPADAPAETIFVGRAAE
jgi:hypothetical protein